MKIVSNEKKSKCRTCLKHYKYINNLKIEKIFGTLLVKFKNSTNRFDLMTSIYSMVKKSKNIYKRNKTRDKFIILPVKLKNESQNTHF